MSDRSTPPARMRYSFESRCRAVQALLAGDSVQAVAARFGAARAGVYRWWSRYRAGGWTALHDRPCTPLRQPRRLSAGVEAELLAVRERTGSGPQVIGAIVGRAASTVGKVLRRCGASRLPHEPQPPVVRYERERPGELVHIDSKKLGRFWNVGKRILGPGTRRSRGAGWQHLHVAVDDHSRLAYAEVLPREDGPACAAFLRRAVHWYAEQGIEVERVLTDNAVPTARVPGVRRARSMASSSASPVPTRRAPTASRALHPDAVAPVGVRLGLPLERAPHARPARLAALV